MTHQIGLPTHPEINIITSEDECLFEHRPTGRVAIVSPLRLVSGLLPERITLQVGHLVDGRFEASPDVRGKACRRMAKALSLAMRFCLLGSFDKPQK